jgi:predicted helicase
LSFGRNTDKIPGTHHPNEPRILWLRCSLCDKAKWVVSANIDHGEKPKPTQKNQPKAKLKADPDHGQIILDTETTLTGIPPIAWDYKLGNRSAIEWVLDQHKEKTPKDPTIRELFNTYRFIDYKDHVIDLLDRVCTVSVRTMQLIAQMPDTSQHQPQKNTKA